MRLNLLVVSRGKQEGKKFVVSRFPFLIGRDAGCHLRPSSPLISSRHCSLEARDEKMFVRDFNSTNGTFVNGVQIKDEHELRESDRLQVGPLDFLVSFGAGASAALPGPTGAKPPPADLDEDAVAAMMLAQEREEAAAEAAGKLGYDEDVPPGSTVLDLTLPAAGAPSSSASAGKEVAPTGGRNSAPAPPPSLLTIEQAGEVLLITVRRPKMAEPGTIEVFKEYLAGVVEVRKQPKILLNLAAVLAMDSTFLAGLVGLNKQVQAAGGTLVLCELRPEVLEIFQVLQLTSYMNIHKLEKDGLLALDPDLLML